MNIKDDPVYQDKLRKMHAVRRYLKIREKVYIARRDAGFNVKEEERVRAWLSEYACYLEADAHWMKEDYEHQIADYRRTIDSYIDADRLSDTSTCKDLPRASGAQPGLVCYTRADISRKVAESLALAAECDEIAIRYKALVKAYQSAYSAKEE